MEAMPMCACGVNEIAPGFDHCDDCAGTGFLPLADLVRDIAYRWANEKGIDPYTGQTVITPSKIQAIKELRMRGGEYFPDYGMAFPWDAQRKNLYLGLKESKDLIDAAWPPYNRTEHELEQVIERLMLAAQERVERFNKKYGDVS